MAGASRSNPRLKALRRKLKEHALDAIIVFDRNNIRYLSGFDGTYARLIVDSRTARLVTDMRYAEVAEGMVRGVRVELQPITHPDDFFAKMFQKSGYKTMGFEGSMSYSDHARLKNVLRPAKTQLKEAGGVIRSLRLVKDEEEIRLLARAARIADKMMARAFEAARPGVSEVELSRVVKHSADDLGSDGESFENIVAGGPNTSRPHHHPLKRRLRGGDPLTIDLGCRLDGYCSDLTRNPVLGKATKKFAEIYEVCLEAQQAAVKAARAGMLCRDLDAVARDIIASRGYGKYFGHGLGHGVGIDIHEPPVLNTRSEEVLEAGHVVTIEPGIYIPGVGGVRIEDLLVITEGRPRVLSKSPRELRILPL